MNLIKAMEALLSIYNFKLDLNDADKWEWKDIKEKLEVFANSIFPASKTFGSPIFSVVVI